MPTASEQSAAADPSRARGASAAFWVSASLICLQVAFTRLLAFKLYYHFVFLAVGLALLGLSAAGSTVAARKRPDDVEAKQAFWLSALLLSVPLVFLLLEAPFLLSDRPTPVTLRGTSAVSYLLWAAPLMLWLFYAGGMVLAYLFSEHSQDMPRLYAWDLLGAAAGCLLCLALMSWASPPVAFLAASLMLLPPCWRHRAATPDARQRKRLLWRVLIGATGALVLCLGPAKLRSFSTLEPFENGYLIKSEWNHLIRTDHVVGRQVGHFGYYVLDNDACTDVIIWDEDEQARELTEPAYIIGRPEPAVAVLGFGGGRQVAEARRARAKSILGIDINPAIARWVQEDDRPYNGGLFDDPSIELRVGEGRHTLRSSGRSFDVVVMHAIDTYSATASGSYALSENFLYTSEAISIFLDALNDDGVVTISRWLFNPPRENLRLFSTALHSLQERGVADPAAHLAMVAPVSDYAEIAGKQVWGYLLISKRPFDEQRLKLLREHVDRQGWTLLYAPEAPSETPFGDLVRAADRDAFAKDYPYKIDPVTDASPYLFQFQDPLDLSSYVSERKSGALGLYRSSAIVLLVAPLLAMVLSGLIVILPLWLSQRGASQGPSPLGWKQALFFTGLGLGFMALEIPLVQTLSLYLGHPTYGFSVALVSLLLFAGLGSLLAGRVPTSRKAAICGGVSVALLVLALTLLPAVHGSIGLPDAVRFPLTVVLTGLFALPMGFPLALGVKELGSAPGGSEGVAWAWGINGAASVVGSCAVMTLMVFAGTNAAFVLGAACYALAAAVSPGWAEDPAPPAEA